MKMCLKLVHYAFSSSPSKDTTMSTFCGFFFTFLLKFKPFDEFFSFQNVIANLSVCVSVCVCVCVCVHPLNKDVSQAIIGTFFQCILQKMVGWQVCHCFMLKFKLFKMWQLNMSLFILLHFLLCMWNVIPYRKGISRKNVLNCRSPHQKIVDIH